MMSESVAAPTCNFVPQSQDQLTNWFWLNKLSQTLFNLYLHN